MAEQDSLKLEKDGTVTAVVGGEKTVLRRPLFGELRELRESLWSAQDVLYDKAAALASARVNLKAASESGDTAEAVDALREFRNLERQDTLASEGACMSLMRTIFETLGGRTLSDDATLPVWMSDYKAIEALMEHWRFVPLVSGNA